MSRFDSYIMVDWSGGNDRGPKPKADAIWVYDTQRGEPEYFRNRALVEDWLATRIEAELAAGRRLCVGFDFPFGYPKGFAKALTGQADPFAVWDWLEARIEDAPKANNRFDIAGQINAKFDGIGPFWGNGLAREIADLPRKGKARTNDDFPEYRVVETRAKGSFTCWQLSGAGAVGSQVLMGLPVLNRLRKRFADQINVWPFEALDAPVAFVEIWPSLLADQVREMAADGGIKDAHQVRLVAEALARMDQAGTLDQALEAGYVAPEEGWILGVGAEDALAGEAALPKPPKLRDDCFALPAGVDWTPVDEAMARLKSALHPVTDIEAITLDTAMGRILARDVKARRANPPAPNSAVDGYGFAYDGLGQGDQVLPLLDGRAAAGAAFQGSVPAGHAIRILTGAVLPEGVDTVVLEEDCNATPTHVAFAQGVKRHANTRKAGEDVQAQEVLLTRTHAIRPQDVALLAATGVDRLSVHKRLRVGILSTGDELMAAGETGGPDRTYDANRPMLLHMARAWGHEAVDLGHAPDDAKALAAKLDDAAKTCDVTLTSGGASAGDEDHISALLRSQGQLHAWRIALKPGRPLALAMWNGTPVFGLPGNPVAAFVCALIFARPALSLMAGGRWLAPQGFMLPAAFEKSKRPGRREYLRARLNTSGQVERFHSEGSGRISGLSWSDGLVELPDAAAEISQGDPVRYIPYASFGL
jgi:molybdopterin molybdotransferase